MEKKEFDSIINFAISKEEEAVEFYQQLQDMVEFKERKDFLKELEDMEKSHITILENIRNKSVEEMKVSEVTDLKISDYIVEVEPYENMTYQDILITGMKREEASHNLYNELADQAGTGDIKTLFEKLASEEAKHKLFFETVYDEEILKEN
jgi:rubrerythrin